MVPVLERALDAALVKSQARTVVVMHDHRHNSRFAGNRAGLHRRLRSADAVVTHSEYVATRVRALSGRDDVRNFRCRRRTSGASGPTAPGQVPSAPRSASG